MHTYGRILTYLFYEKPKQAEHVWVCHAQGHRPSSVPAGSYYATIAHSPVIMIAEFEFLNSDAR